MLIVLYVITTVGYISYSDYSLLKSVKEVGVIYGAIFYVGLIFIAIGIFLSTLLKSSKGSSGVVMGIVFGTFFIRMMGVVIEDLRFLTYFSPIDWIKVQKLMTEGIKIEEWIIGSLIIVICSISAHKIYNRKDLRF